MIEKLSAIIKFVIEKAKHGTRLTTGTMPFFSLSTRILIGKNAKLHLGNRVKTFDSVSISIATGECTIGAFTAMNRNCIVVCKNHISIGEMCHIGPNVCIYDHDHKFGYNGIYNDEYNCSPIIIGDGCWIGANVTILRGTIIGEYSVIGAGTVVKGNIPPHSIVTSDRKIIIRQIVSE